MKSSERQAAAPHRLIDVQEVTESYSALICREAKQAIAEIWGKLIHIAGGTDSTSKITAWKQHAVVDSHEEDSGLSGSIGLARMKTCTKGWRSKGLVIPQLNRRPGHAGSWSTLERRPMKRRDRLWTLSDLSRWWSVLDLWSYQS